ncbi:vacuolar proton ATPase, putative [Ixodes scapularis]|uniref:V-type proton ATPase subunit a n=1 Tax=Ixodes scapularis TaxID=6945 RepID=B7QHZ0_IXOSC|nr:vacuolar proton ATPase, putative [Ixodes scapularis]|eukprot:XP_002414797.1 vacuolar proton ATPase, putative [Ixodes scapularis]
MGSLFRSEPMTLCQLFIQSEAAFNCVAELGELGLVQFRDLNPDVNAFQRKFVNEIRRCDEMERKLRFVEREIKNDQLPLPEDGDEVGNLPQARDMVDLEANVDRLECELREINENNRLLQKNYVELTEIKLLLRTIDDFFDQEEGAIGMHVNEGDAAHSSSSGSEAHVQIGFTAGVVPTVKFAAFERMLWRVCKGNVFVRNCRLDTPIEDPTTGDPVLKSAFVVFFQGEKLKARIKKICDGFHATRYAVSSKPAERRQMAVDVMTRLEDLNMVRTNKERNSMQKTAAQNARDIFSQLRFGAEYDRNNISSSQLTCSVMIAEKQYKTAAKIADVFTCTPMQDASDSHVPSILNRMETSEKPPTFNRTNKFTRGFQNIVDAYGVSSYREVNPAPYAIITFPFLFAVMFGDAGHGLIMFLFALFLVLRETSLQKIKNAGEIWDTFFNGRYIIMLMGLFSIYTGLIYNDIFSKSANVFGSSWHGPKDLPFGNKTSDQPIMLNPKENYAGTPYPFGLDPVWMMAQNKIPFTNSYKMKMAIILGVMQMLFGVVLNIWNHLFLRTYMNIWTEFVPEVIFLTALFGYLVVLIVFKWTLPDGAPNGEGAGCSRSLLIMFINMFLMTYTKDPCYQDLLYPGQKPVQMALLAVAFLSVPWLLLAKPLFLYYLYKKHSSDKVTGFQLPRAHLLTASSSSAHSPVTASSTPEEALVEPQDCGHVDLGDVFIHQIIHTIEYCLGAISNTASYLRLWALSLAHSRERTATSDL